MELTGTYPTRWRKKPTEVHAIQWTGDNEVEVIAFTGKDYFETLGSRWRGDPATTAQVYDRLHSTWVLMKTGDWIIRGVQGEFYPIKDDVLHDTYDCLELS